MPQLPEDLQHYVQPDTVRFQQYSRLTTFHGRSLTLAQILAHLKKRPEFAEFDAVLFEAINAVRRLAQLQGSEQAAVVRALQSHAASEEEIAEDTRLPRRTVKRILGEMITAGTVIVRYRNHHLANNNARQALYFLEKGE